MWNAVLQVARGVKPCNLTVVRGKSTYTRAINIAKPQKLRQEPVEVIKWVLLVIPVGSFGLGCWQMYRLRWKLDLIEMMQRQANTESIDLPQDFSDLDKMEYLPVKVRGEFLHEKEFVIGPRALIEHNTASARVGSLVSDPKKNQGWLVVTPFKISDSGEVVLVNRGWVPQRLRASETRKEGLVKGEITLTGVVRLTENRPPFMPKNNPEKRQWFYRDLHEMSQYIGCAPVWLDARGIADPPPGWPQPNQTRVSLRNEHFSYLVTWYSLSGLTALMWYRYFVKKLPLI